MRRPGAAAARYEQRGLARAPVVIGVAVGKSKQKRGAAAGHRHKNKPKTDRKENNSCLGPLHALCFPCTCLCAGKRSGCYFTLIVACLCPKLFRCFDQRQFEEIRNPLWNVSKKQEDEAPFLVLSLLQKFPILTSQKHLF